jgi:hypothetical protein
VSYATLVLFSLHLFNNKCHYSKQAAFYFICQSLEISAKFTYRIGLLQLTNTIKLTTCSCTKDSFHCSHAESESVQSISLMSCNINRLRSAYNTFSFSRLLTTALHTYVLVYPLRTKGKETKQQQKRVHGYARNRKFIQLL